LNSLKDPKNWLLLKRNVRFGDIDAAGVIHFHHLLRWAHESWEESLEIFGLSASDIFPGSNSSKDEPEVALPIVHCQADFAMPIRIGDILDIKIEPIKINSESFKTTIHFYRDKYLVGSAVLHHLAINSSKRKRCHLPDGIDLWLEASALGRVRPL